MATLQQQLTKAKKLQPKKLQDDLFKFVKSIEKELIDIEKNRILNESKDIQGNDLGFYSFATEQITKGRKKAGQPFTGFETGDFFKGFNMQEVSGVIGFNSSDPKTNAILNSEAWLSTEIFGLSDNELKKVIAERLLPFFIENTRKTLDL
jgi:hypothetical protein